MTHESKEFLTLQPYFRQSKPATTEGTDRFASKHRSPAIEDIFRITVKDASRPLWHAIRSSNVAGIRSRDLRIAHPGVTANGLRGATEYISRLTQERLGTIAIHRRVTERRFCCFMKR
jgi:hypothetical protein